MPHDIPLEKLSAELLDVLDEVFEHHHGIFLDKGTSLFETLENVSAADASRAASARSASIAAQIKHVTFYLRVLDDYLSNKTVGKVDWREIWRTTSTVSPEEWQALKDELRQAHQQVLTRLKTPDSWNSDNTLGGALAIVAHTAYHLGGIRQALCVIR
jgi:hypothetical protein